MRILVDALYFPQSHLVAGCEVSNIVTIANDKPFPIMYKMKTTHPQELLADPRSGRLLPGDSTDVVIKWRTHTRITDFQTFRELTPSAVPKLLFEYIDATQPQAQPVALRVPVLFTQPKPTDKFHYFVDDAVYCTVQSKPRVSRSTANFATDETHTARRTSDAASVASGFGLDTTNRQTAQTTPKGLAANGELWEAERERREYMEKRYRNAERLRAEQIREEKERMEMARRRKEVERLAQLADDIDMAHKRNNKHGGRSPSESCPIC
eukprot:TRINITY_DN1450_c0_g1_i1.p1 TRINITY_DN1450_c0_g1~~TRINITY_DN1450_c0_g1_i1.p1  ORF type:complete len:267 (+),score=35.45 TRINITY_DN1450_c0_g1_i1:62-862(+)